MYFLHTKLRWNCVAPGMTAEASGQSCAFETETKLKPCNPDAKENEFRVSDACGQVVYYQAHKNEFFIH